MMIRLTTVHVISIIIFSIIRASLSIPKAVIVSFDKYTASISEADCKAFTKKDVIFERKYGDFQSDSDTSTFLPYLVASSIPDITTKKVSLEAQTNVIFILAQYLHHDEAICNVASREEADMAMQALIDQGTYRAQLISA